jgi:uncharacterized protein with PIN domain/tRNA(Ser,Leu) C12 N-acetylase TAN1
VSRGDGAPRAPRLFLVRFAEVGRDGQPGRQGVRRDLGQEIERELPGARVTAPARGRLIVECEEDAGPVLGRLPGVTSYSPCRRVEVGSAARAAAELAAAALPAGGRFAVRIKRVGEHGFRSRDLVAEVARAICDAVPGARVDLAAPDLTVGVEVRGPDCLVFGEVVAGVDRGAPPPRESGEPRFLADQMLGRLAVWLRLLGFDTASWRDRPDSWLQRRARDEGRVILTQDGPLSRAASTATYYVEGRDLDAQLAEVIRAFDLRLDRSRLLSRCTRCNLPIEPVAVDSVEERVPAAVRQRVSEFFRCPSCDQVYWEGDHVRRILARLSSHFPSPG